MMVLSRPEDQSLVYLELDVYIMVLDFKGLLDALQALEVIFLLSQALVLAMALAKDL